MGRETGSLNTVPSNYAQCTGRIVYKNFSEEEGTLYIVLSLFSPKWASREQKTGSHSINADHPSFIINGDQAEACNDEFDIGDYVTVIGYADTRETFVFCGNNTYRKKWTTAIVAKEVFRDQGHENVNFVTVSGEIIRVYRNDEKGKKLYIITVKTQKDKDTPEAKVNFAHFDVDMKLEPEKGNRIFMTGSIHTKNARSDESGRSRRIKLTSIVAKSITVIRQ